MTNLFGLPTVSSGPHAKDHLRGNWRRKRYRIANKNRNYDPTKYHFEPVKITPRGEKDFTSKRAEERRKSHAFRIADRNRKHMQKVSMRQGTAQHYRSRY